MNQIFLDIDGCVLCTDSFGPEMRNDYYEGLTVLSSYIKAGNERQFPKISFCTGRDRNYVEAVAYVLGLPDSWSVIESGVALFNPKTKELVFNPALTNQIREIFHELSQIRIPQILKKHPYLFVYPGNMINIALERKYGASSSIEECFEAVKEELKDFEELLHITYSNIAIDISPAGIDKGSGIEFLAKRTGIDLEHSLGVGDSKGDFLMFERLGYVGCPENASQECKDLVKKRKGWVAEAKYSLGTAEIIRYFFAKGNLIKWMD